MTQILAAAVMLIGFVLIVAGIAIATSSGAVLSRLYLLVSQIPGFPLTCEFSGVDLPAILGNTVAGVLFSLTGIIDLLAGWGLWIRRKWARMLIIIVFAIAAFFGLYNILTYGFSRVFATIPWSIPAMIINVLIVYYLLRTKS